MDCDLSILPNFGVTPGLSVKPPQLDGWDRDARERFWLLCGCGYELISDAFSHTAVPYLDGESRYDFVDKLLGLGKSAIKKQLKIPRRYTTLWNVSVRFRKQAKW